MFKVSTISNHQFLQKVTHLLNRHSMGLLSDDECVKQLEDLYLDKWDMDDE